jgi:hypothetical protein
LDEKDDVSSLMPSGDASIEADCVFFTDKDEYEGSKNKEQRHKLALDDSDWFALA